MRLRLRDPTGSSTLSLAESATVAELHNQITSKTSIPSFDLKYGYPPKPLLLEDYGPATRLSDLQVKLDGEQLIVSARGDAATPRPSQAQQQPAKSSSTSSFSFAGAPAGESIAPSSSSSSSATRPLSLSRKQTPSLESDPPELPVPTHGGTLTLRIMPDDNSCMFRAFGSAMLGSLDSMHELRSLIAQTIQEQPDVYTRAILEQAPDDYCAWIQTPDAWGGGIELSILSAHFDIEICSIDVQTLRVDRFNEGRPTRCILVYSGIHYDTIALSPSDPPYSHAYAPPEFDTKVFDAADQIILDQAVEVCRVLQGRHYFTDTAAFTIKCNTCGGQFKGEKGATEHAKQTGHYDFGEAE
ncbi:MAG: hypothetical protein M1819_005786 [Sarea resinae]|nr:MAG: hypothetical protein M1819_005786 [Sarea resinae]